MLNTAPMEDIIRRSQTSPLNLLIKEPKYKRDGMRLIGRLHMLLHKHRLNRPNCRKFFQETRGGG